MYGALNHKVTPCAASKDDAGWEVLLYSCNIRIAEKFGKWTLFQSAKSLSNISY